jgi:ABC-2 type transport system permease protein
MTGAFWYLTVHTLRNRLIAMLRRVKHPRYAIGMLFVVGYFGFLVWGQINGFGGKGRPSLLQNEGVRAIGPVLLAIVMMSNWIGGTSLTALAFSQAEVHMLFPAPVTRRALIVLKMVRMQLRILLNVVIIMVLWGGGANVGGSRWLNAIGLYTIFSTMYLHRVGAALVRASTLKHGRAGLKRTWASVAVGVVIAAGFVVLFLSISEAAHAGDPDFGATLTRVKSTLSLPWVHALLTPFRLIAGPALARTTTEWWTVFPGAAAMLALHAVWVLRSQTAFEEAAAEQSANLRAMIDNWRKRGIATPNRKVKAGRFTLPLAPTGHPALAIVWKNSLSFIRTLQPAVWLLVLATPGIVGLIARDQGAKALVGVAIVSAVLAFILLLVGGLSVRNDLRADLLNLSSLKTIPLRGSTIMFAEVVSSALPLAIIQTVLLWIGLVALQVSPKPFDPSVQVALVLTVPLGTLGLNILVSTIRNAVAIMFPAWVKLGADAEVGIEMMGQNMLSMLATLIGFLLLSIVPALLTLFIVALLHAPPTIAVAASIVLGGVITIAEAYLVSLSLGRTLEELEPSASLTAA